MNLTDLRDELTTHADDLGTATDLRAGVAAKVTQTKRRRAVAVGAGATLAVAALAVGVVTSLGRPSPTVPAGTPSSTAPMIGADGLPYRAVPDAHGDIIKDGFRLRAHSADSLLAGGAIGDVGQRSLDVDWNPTTKKISLTVECYGPTTSPTATRDLMVRARVGALEGYVSMSCSATAPGGDLPVGGLELGPSGQGSADVTVGSPATLHVDLVDRQNRPVSRPGVRLVAAVYELGPQTEVRDAAQQVVGLVPDALEHQGYTYRLLALTAGPLTDVARRKVELEAPSSGPYLVTYGTVGTGSLRANPGYYTLDGLTGQASQVQEGGRETVPQSAGRGQWLTVQLGEGSPNSTGTAYIATYVLAP